MRRPLVGEPVSFGQFFPVSSRNHLLGVIGSGVWSLGTVFDFVAASLTGVAISYAIGQAAPMVAALWGVLVGTEFSGASSKAQAYLIAMFVFFVLAIVLISVAYRAR